MSVNVSAHNLTGPEVADAYEQVLRSHGMSLVEAGAWLGIGAAAGGVIGTVASGILIDRLRLRDARRLLPAG